jgi:hypothetical protein
MIVFLAFGFAFLFSPARPAAPPYGLPVGAVVIEAKTIPAPAHPNRALILWMLKPKKNPLSYGPEEYTCPDETRGSYYSGPTRVSLVDVPAGKIINTIDIKEEPDDDTFDIPYKIRAHYYQVPGVVQRAEGKPAILAFKDYNGDGQALEFALFDAVACMGLQTTLIGYSRTKDRVIQYPIILTSSSNGRRSEETSYWIDYLFSQQQSGPSVWKYEIDYRGRDGTLDKYEIRYNAQRERFEGTLSSTREEP